MAKYQNNVSGWKNKMSSTSKSLREQWEAERRHIPLTNLSYSSAMMSGWFVMLAHIMRPNIRWPVNCSGSKLPAMRNQLWFPISVIKASACLQSFQKGRSAWKSKLPKVVMQTCFLKMEYTNRKLQNLKGPIIHTANKQKKRKKANHPNESCFTENHYFT